MTWIWKNTAIIAILLLGCATIKDRTRQDLLPREPSASEPVTATLGVPAQARAGQRFNVLVTLRIAGAHHIYATQTAAKPFAPVNLKFHYPKGIETLGALEMPTPEASRNGDIIYTGSVTFRQLCRVRSNVSKGPMSIQCELRYQACTAELCWPPGSIQLASTIDIRTGEKGNHE
jgi:hypothetical protein